MTRTILSILLCMILPFIPSYAQEDRGKAGLEQYLEKKSLEDLYPGYRKGTLKYSGLEREYLYYIPGFVTGKPVPMPVVVMLHGGSGSAAGETHQSRFHLLAEKEGFIVVYPNSSGGWWNDGRSHLILGEAHRQVDDAGFICALIDTLKRRNPVDTQRIYAAGISNGAFMCQRLAAERADVFAAVAVVAGGMEVSLADHFSPSAPVSVMMINGNEDPLVPYEGGRMGTNEKPRGETIAIGKAVDLWIGHNRCAPGVQELSIPDRDTSDGCTAKKYIHTGGAQGTEVVLVSVCGGGHTWPGTEPYAPALLIGRTCHDFDATTLIWEFFKTHPKKDKEANGIPKSVGSPED
ncbi:MAG: prolyl oligopeptidase family serine peptidase [Bacteroidales bacterium]|nr:prolyl oligopeptidase family serine peptidase [Bacteroidales bacterium]